MDSRLEVEEVVLTVANVVAVFVVPWELYAVVLYRPPSYTEEENESLRNFVGEFCSCRNVVVVGDFNLPTLNWMTPLSPVEEYVSPLDRTFYDVFCSSGLIQVVR